jgi:hypothetical protein
MAGRPNPASQGLNDNRETRFGAEKSFSSHVSDFFSFALWRKTGSPIEPTKLPSQARGIAGRLTL